MEEENAFLKNHEFSYLEKLSYNPKFLYSAAAVCFLFLIIACVDLNTSIKHNAALPEYVDFSNINFSDSGIGVVWEINLEDGGGSPNSPSENLALQEGRIADFNRSKTRTSQLQQSSQQARDFVAEEYQNKINNGSTKWED